MALGYNNPFAPSVGSFRFPVTPPDVDPDEGQLVQVCFNPDWLPFVLGALQQLTLQATWAGDEAAVLLAQQRAMTLLAMVGSADGGCEDRVCLIDMRYNSETDTIQQTFDGGATWVNQPGADPRHGDIFRFPPNTAEDPKCQAAANMTRYISNLISEVETVVDTAGEAEGLVAILLALFIELGAFGILIDLVLGLAAVLFGAGSLALETAFTNTVFDQLTCIFDCHIESDGTVTADDLTQILFRISTDIGGLASDVLSAMFFLMGEVGLSNAGAKGDAPADCSGCDCGWCFKFFFVDGFNDFVPLTNIYGTYGTTSGSGIQSAFFAAPAFDNLMQVNMTRDFGGIAVDSIEVVTNDPNWNGTPSQFFINNNGTNILLEDMNPDLQTHTLTSAITLGAMTIGTSQSNQGSAQPHWVVSLTLKGTGTNPFGADNC